MNARVLLILAALTSLTVLPVQAQVGNCDIDLSPVIAQLVQAQSSSSGGNFIEAARLKAEARARADLEELETACLDADDDIVDTGPVTLGETNEMDTEFGQFTFQFPSGWRGQEIEGLQVLGNTDTVFDIEINDPEFPWLVPGEVIALVGPVTARSLGVADIATIIPGPLDFLKLLGQDTPDLVGEFEDARPLELENQEAAIGRFTTDELAIALLLSDFGTTRPIDERLYGLVMLITSLNEQTDWFPTAEAMLASMAMTTE